MMSLLAPRLVRLMTSTQSLKFDDCENKWVDESSSVDYGEANGDCEMMKEEMERLREENNILQ